MVGPYPWRTRQHCTHDRPLHTDAATMDDSHGFQSQLVRFFEIGFDNRGDLPRMDRVQVERVSDGNADWLLRLHAVRLRHQRTVAKEQSENGATAPLLVEYPVNPENLLQVKKMISNTIRMPVLASTMVLALVPVSLLASAQQDPAPVPAAIIEAKKVFISNTGRGCFPFGESLFSGAPNRAYDQFYAAMKSWGKYEMVGSPADADLDLEITFACPAAGANVTQGHSVGFGYDAQLRLVILDVRTRLVLWGITQHVEPAVLQGNRDRNFDRAITQLMNSLKHLTAGSSATSSNGSGSP